MSEPQLEAERLLRDVVAFAALPTIWVGTDATLIARSLAESIHRTLGAASVAVVVEDHGAMVDVRAGADVLGDAVREWRTSKHVDPPALAVPIGPFGERGAILLSTDGLDQRRMLLARLAASLADAALREAGLAREASHRREELLRLEKLSALGQLVSGVAHELRTPLTYAGNAVQLLVARVDRMGLSWEDREFLTTQLREIEDAQDRIRATVGTLRRWSSPVQTAPTSVPLSETVAEAVRLFLLTQARPVRVTRNLVARGLVKADRVQLQQVVLNLLQNSAEAIRPEGIITVSTADEDERIVLCVEDDGPGIPPEVEGKLFEPFFTTKATGTGLGLSIVRRIVEAHRATIAVTRSAAGGARFEVRLPAQVS